MCFVVCYVINIMTQESCNALPRALGNNHLTRCYRQSLLHVMVYSGSISIKMSLTTRNTTERRLRTCLP